MAKHRQYKKKTEMPLLIVEERVKHVGEKAVKEYKASDNFRFKVAEGAISSYHIDFKSALGR